MIVVWDVWWLKTEPTVKGWTASYLATTSCQPSWLPLTGETSEPQSLCWWWWTVAGTKIHLQIFQSGAWDQWGGRTEIIFSLNGDVGK